MSRIRGKHTSIELKVRKYFREKGYKYKLHAKLPGRPDIIFTKARSVVLVHGCFWHGHNCIDGHIPKTNTRFWKRKIITNKQRDIRNKRALQKLGWKVFVIYECQIESNLEKSLKKTDQHLAGTAIV